MRKLLSIILLMAVAFGVYAKISERAPKGYVPLEEYHLDVSKENPDAFTFSVKVPTDHLLWYSSLVRPFFPEFESHFEGGRKADYISQLTGSLASPRGPPTLVAGPVIGRRIAAPTPVAAAGGTALFLDESGLGSAAGAWSTARKLRSAYAGSCIRVRRSSDNTEQDIGFVGDALDTSSLATFCSGTDGFVVTVYEQSGNSRDITQSTAASQPQIVSSGTIFTGANGKPECRFDGSNDHFLPKSFTLNQPATVFCTFKPISFTANDSIYDGFSNISMLFFQASATVNYSIYAGTASTVLTFANGTPALSIGVFNGASSVFAKNNDSESSVSIGTANAGGVTVGTRGGGSFFGNFGFQELVVYASAKDSTARATARSNINAFYAIY